MSKPSIIKPPEESKHIFLGIHGDPGMGKTRIVGTTPGRVLVIRPPQEHFDSWLPADRARARRGEIEEAVVKDWDDMNDLLAYLRSEGGKLYDWVWVDNASILSDVLLDDVFKEAIERKPSRKSKSSSPDEFPGGPIDQGEYGINMSQYARWLRHIVGADLFNFGFTAHSETARSPDKDSDGDPIEKLMPWIQGKGQPGRFASYTNVLAFYHKAKIGGQDDRRVLRMESAPTYYAKDQFDAFDGRLVDPTMPKLIAAIDKKTGRSGGVLPEKTTQRKPARTASRRVTRKGR
jgi:hypothetical protein